MELVEKKAAIAQVLRGINAPLSIKELGEKLSGSIPERTLRRYLGEMVAEGLLLKVGEGRSTRYVIFPSFAKAPSQPFRPESREILEKARRPLFERFPIAYVDEWLDSYTPNKTFYIPAVERLRLSEAGKRSSKKDPAGTYAHQIFHRLLIDLSYNSSRLEGNTYSLLDTQKLVLEGTGVEGKLDQEKIMILNHKEAIRYLVDTAPRLSIDEKTICTLHYLLSDGLVSPEAGGKIRSHGVRIGGSAYIPFENPKELEPRLQNILQKAARIEDPFEQSFFLLVHLTYLQAFEDVNKRTARLSANIPLIRRNLVPLSFNDVEKEDYTTAVIAIYEYQEVGPLLDLYLFSYFRTCVLYDSTIQALGYDEIRVRYRQERRGLLREIILQKMSGKTLDQFITTQAKKSIPEAEREFFIEDVFEDLKNMSSSRSVGLGVTQKQLDAWLKIYSKR